MLTRKYYKLIRVSYADSDIFHISNVSDQAGNFTISNGGGTMKYSLNGVDFTTYDFTTRPTISVPAGGNIYLKGNKTNPGSSAMELNLDVDFTIGGNIMSIVDETNYSTMTTIPSNAFYNLFRGKTHLISAADVNLGNVTTVGNYAFEATFQSCNLLTTPPDFSGITTINQGGFNSTFYGCPSLTTAPNFSGVTSLGTSGMRSMFAGCTSLTIGCDISGITTVGQTALTETYTGCSSLTTAYAPNLSTWSGTSNWLNRVAATGTLYCPSQAVADIITNNSPDGCPTGWQKVVA